jgi:hypothetical protein
LRCGHGLGAFGNQPLPALRAAAITDFEPANILLPGQITWQNARRPSHTAGLAPDADWQLALDQKRFHLKPAPPAPLRDLHFAIHPEREFRVITHPPSPPAFAWPTILAHYSV